MKVWFINQYTEVASATSGNRPFMLARALEARGHEVLVIGGTFDHVGRADRFPGKRWTYGVQQVGGIRVLWVAVPPHETNDGRRVLNMVTFAARVAGLARADRRLGRPDVVIGSSPHLLVPLAAERLARHFSVPFVMEIRDIWPASIVDLTGMSPRHPVVTALEGLERHLCGAASEIVSLLPGGVAHLQGLGVDPGRVTWIPNGVDLSVIPELSAPPVGDLFTLMYAGSHGVSDGLVTLIEAAAELEAGPAKGSVRWRLIGDGPQKPSLKVMAHRAGLENILFEDAVPKTEIYDRLAQAHAFVLNVRDEPIYRFGISFNKIFDYLAMGRPTIVGLDSPWNPFADSGAGLTVRPDDPSAFAAGVLEVLAMPEDERRAMGERGRAFVEGSHDIDRLGGTLEEVLLRARADV